MAITTAHSVKSLRHALANWCRAGERIALVPTMGALHEGHLALARLGREHADRIVVSIFVNPTQFGPNEDLANYPRTFEQDRDKLEGVADLIFAPDVEEIYPPGAATTISLVGPAAAGLEDRFRPTHFEGVATVVAKLLIQALPDAAIFGEKDFQQLKVVTRMVRDLHLPVRIVAAPTVRESDGLALSSRNRYLSAEERTTAPLLFRALQGCADAIRGGAEPAQAAADAAERLTEAGFAVDYLECRNGETLEPPSSVEEPLRVLAAARLGATRLIDNIGV